MGYAELIQQRLQTLSPEKQAEVYASVEFISTRTHAAKAQGIAQSERNAPADCTDEEFS